MAEYIVSSGQVSAGITLNAGDTMIVSDGGTAETTTINEGWMDVMEGAVAAGVTVNLGGWMNVSAGATATNVVENGGGIQIGSDAKVIFTPNAFSGLVLADENEATVHSGTTAVSPTVNPHGYLYVSSGGSATNVVENGGFVTVDDDAYATFTPNAFAGLVLSDWANATVHSGTTATDTAIYDGVLEVYKGGLANNTTVNPQGDMYVYSGGTATVVENGGYVEVEEGANVTFTPNAFAGLVLSDWTNATVHSGTTATGTTIDFAGDLSVFNGGTVKNTTVNDAGKLFVLDGGTADGITVGEGGFMDVYAGGTATGIVASNGARLVITVAPDTYVQGTSAGTAFEVKDAAISGFTTNADNILHVHFGGTANNTTVNEDGSLHAEGGTVENTTVNAGGALYVYDDEYGNGTAKNTTINADGELIIDDGGKVTGTLQIADGAIVNAEEGAEINFDLSDRKTTDAALVNNLSLVDGTPDFTLTVSASQDEGKYSLAGGSADFSATISVRLTDETVLGDITVGGTLSSGEKTYSLAKANGLLSFTVSGAGVVPAPGGLTAGDLNGDGRADVIMSITQSGHGAEGATGAWLIQKDQTPVWGNLSQRNSGWEIFGTGRTAIGKKSDDVYVRSTGNIIGAWTTDNSGNVTGWETIGEFSSDTEIVGLGDFNGSGQTDLLLRNANGAVGCFFTDGEGWNYFQSLGDEWKLSAIGDLNGDGRDDVVLKHDAGFAGSWLTQADGTMAWADLDTLPEGFAIVGAGDFDGDGTDDVLLQKGSYFGAWLVQDGNAAGWMGLGDLPNVTVEQIADFDGDGADDLRVRTTAGDLGTQLVKGADTLEWKYYGSVGDEWSTALAAL